MAVIKTELEAALRAGGHDDVREALVAALEECDRLAQLAEDLLVIARASEGKLPIRPEPLSRCATCLAAWRPASRPAPASASA